MPVQHDEVIKVLANCASTLANDTVAKGKDGSFPDQGVIVVCGRFGTAISVYPKAALFPFVPAFCGSRRASRRSQLQNSTRRGDCLNEHTLIGQAQLVLSGEHSIVQVAKRGGLGHMAVNALRAGRKKLFLASCLSFVKVVDTARR